MLLIRNANIKTMAGPDLKNGCLLLENGKIAAVGQTVDAPEGVETLDAQGRLLTPGCVEAHCHIGLDNEGMRWEGMDYNEIVEPLTPQLRAIDSINPQDEAFGLALRGGVTTACTGPGSANVVGGTFAIVKLAGKRVDRMILRAPAAMKCAFGENPKGCYGHDKRQSPMTRMAVAALLRELLLRTLRDVATNPIILGILAGMLWSVLKIPQPVILQKSVSYLGNMATPLALIALGASFQLKSAKGKLGLTLGISAVKLFLFCGLFLPAAVWLGFRTEKLIAILIMLGSATTCSCFVMAKNMKHEGTITACTVMMTTLLSAFSLTMWLFVLKSLGYI